MFSLCLQQISSKSMTRLPELSLLRVKASHTLPRSETADELILFPIMLD